MRALLATDSPTTGIPVARLMRFCLATRELPTLFGAATGGAREPVRIHALHAVGHLPQQLTERQADLLAATLVRDDQAEAADGRVVDATLYALGMHGRTDAVAGSETERVRQLHDWWQAAGVRVLA